MILMCAQAWFRKQDVFFLVSKRQRKREKERKRRPMAWEGKTNRLCARRCAESTEHFPLHVSDRLNPRASIQLQITSYT